MRIGIDIDGVLTNCEQYCIDNFSKYLVERGIPYKVTGLSDYVIAKSFGLSPDAEDDFWEEDLIPYSKNEPARPFASEVIKKLKADGHDIYIITARWTTNEDSEAGENMRNIVKNWLKENEIYYDKLIFTRAKNEKKVDEILENKIDIMIEDNPNNIIELSKLLPVICYSASYNTKCTGKNITRCISWYDIYRIIGMLKSK